MKRDQLKPGSRLWSLFHKAWGQAQAGPEYDKEVWKQLESVILESDEVSDTPSSVKPRGDEKC